MALLFLDSFDYVNVSITSANYADLLRRKWALVDLLSFEDGIAVAGAHGGNALQFGHQNQFIRTGSLRDQTADEIGVCGMRIKLHNDTVVGNNDTFFGVYTGGRDNLTFRINQTGTVSAYRDDATFLEESPVLFFVNQGWMYLEIKWRIHDSLGTWEFKIDGSTVWTASTYDTKVFAGNFYWDGVQIELSALAVNTHLDDLYILDGSGSVNNDYLGDTVVEFLNPDADGTTSTFTPSSGTDHSALVDEAQSMTAPIDETDHLEGDTTGEKSLFTYENLAILDTASLIHGVQVSTWRRITAEQPLGLGIVARENVTESRVDHTVRHDQTDDMFTDQTVFEQNPDTTAAWTPAEIDSAEFGVEMP